MLLLAATSSIIILFRTLVYPIKCARNKISKSANRSFNFSNFSVPRLISIIERYIFVIWISTRPLRSKKFQIHAENPNTSHGILVRRTTLNFYNKGRKTVGSHDVNVTSKQFSFHSLSRAKTVLSYIPCSREHAFCCLSTRCEEHFITDILVTFMTKSPRLLAITELYDTPWSSEGNSD